MKLRTIVFVLFAPTLLSALAAASLFGLAVNSLLLSEADNESEILITQLSYRVSDYLLENQRLLKALANVAVSKGGLGADWEKLISRFETVRAQFETAFPDVSWCVFDRNGNLPLCSKRIEHYLFTIFGDSFRLRLNTLTDGVSCIYLAPGLSSNDRSIYCFCPISGETENDPAGFAIVRFDASPLDRLFPRSGENIVVLADAAGVVVASNRPEWVNGKLETLPPKLPPFSSNGPQQSDGSRDKITLRFLNEEKAEDLDARKFQVYRTDFQMVPGWRLLLLHDDDYFLGQFRTVFWRVGLLTIPLVILFILPSAWILYRHERKKAEQQEKMKKDFEMTRSLLRGVMDGGEEGEVVIDRVGKPIIWNRRFIELWRIPDQVLCKCEDKKFLPFLNSQLADSESINFSLRREREELTGKSPQVLRLADGRVFEFRSECCRFDDQIMWEIWKFTDITDYLKIQVRLAEREELYREIFETNQAIKLLLDPADETIIDANSAAIRFYGYSREEFLGKKISDLNASPSFENSMYSIRGKGERFRIDSHRTASGEIRCVEVFSNPIILNGRSLIFAIIHDVTERHRSEELLTASQKRLEDVIGELPIGVAIHNAEGRVLYANIEAQRIFGVGEREINGKSLDDPIWCFVGEDGNTILPEGHPVRQVAISGRRIRNLPMGVLQVNKWRLKSVVASAYPIFDAFKRTEMIVAAYIDVSHLEQ